MIGIKKNSVNTIVSFLMLCTSFTACFSALQSPQGKKVRSSPEFKEALWWAQKNVVHVSYKSAQAKTSFLNLPRTMNEAVSFMNIPGLVKKAQLISNPSEADKAGMMSYGALRDSIKNPKESADFTRMIAGTIGLIEKMENITLKGKLEDLLIQTVLECEDQTIRHLLQAGLNSTALFKTKLDQAKNLIAQLIIYINKPEDGLQLQLARKFFPKNPLPVWLTQLVNKTVEAVALLNTYTTNEQSREKFLHIASELPTDVLRVLGPTFFTQFIERTMQVRAGAEKEFIEMLERRLLIDQQALTVI